LSALYKVFARLFQKAVASTDSGGRAPQSAKSYFGVFFLIAFSFAPSSSKEKADKKPSPAGEGVARSVTDEESFYKET
jgi:hypothetical protein